MLKVVFRTDSSLDIGTGHVMRCLTVANELRHDGASCLFICRELPGNLIASIRAHGFQTHVLPHPGSVALVTDKVSHASWLGVGWAEDADQSAAAIAEFCEGGRADWLIVDHYALDSRWEDALCERRRALLVIDDLADREHHCDALLDQNIGRTPADYASLVNPGCRFMTGPKYALLRPEFASLRAASLERRRVDALTELLISLGGVDKDNATGAVLEGLTHCELPADLAITIVMGRKAPWLEAVREQAARLPWRIRIATDVADMASVMARADLAIGAAGTTTWERCCLGLPSLVLGTAENQRYVLSQLAAEDVAVVADIGEIRARPRELGGLVRRLVEKRAEYSARAAALTEGKGCALLLQFLYEAC